MFLRRVLSILLALVVSIQFTTVFAQTDSDTSPELVEYSVIGSSANLRAGAGTSFAIVDQVSEGDSLLIYAEEPETEGWLRVYREGEDDAFIADYLVERAPVRFYPADQEPIIEVSGVGKDVTDILEIPQGIYRIDASVSDRSFILKTLVIEGDCRDDTVFNELNLDANSLNISGLFISRGCSVIFETDNVDAEWQFAIRDVVVSAEFLAENMVAITDDYALVGSGRSLTMATLLPAGVWTINAETGDNAIIVRAHVLTGDCDDTAVFNEFQSGGNGLSLSTAYRSPGDGCVIFWETSNIEENWEITFDKLR